MILALLSGAWSAFARLPRGWHIAIGVVGLCLVAFTLHHCAISDAVEADRKAVEAETAKQALGAERAANRSDATRQTEIQANDDQARKVIDDAVANDPEDAARPAGPAVRAVTEQLRNR